MRKIINKFGETYYYNENDKLHREDGPAKEYPNGYKAWYKNGLCHREDGPAIEYSNGAKEWYKNGKLHREDGPAIEYTNDDMKYWYNDEYYPDIKTDEDWKRFVKLMVFL